MLKVAIAIIPINIATVGFSYKFSLNKPTIKENSLVGIKDKLIKIAKYFGLANRVSIE